MENKNLLSAFSYLSIFFAPLLVPLAIYFFSKDREVKHHSMRALLSHLIPLALGILFFILFIFSTLSFSLSNPSEGNPSFLIFWIVGFAVYLIVSLGIFIWNIIQAIRIIR